MITIYHLGVSQSDRIVWLMEELELPYELEWFDRGEDQLAPPEYLALHPAATAPVIRDGDKVLADSAAIVEYISQRYANGKLSVPVEAENYPDYLYWMQFNNNIMASFFVTGALEGLVEEGQENLFLNVATRRQQAYYRHLDEQLTRHDYVAGPDFTCADIMAMFPLTMFSASGHFALDDFANIGRYVNRISQRPAYAKAMSIAGPAAQRS